MDMAQVDRYKHFSNAGSFPVLEILPHIDFYKVQFVLYNNVLHELVYLEIAFFFHNLNGMEPLCIDTYPDDALLVPQISFLYHTPAYT